MYKVTSEDLVEKVYAALKSMILKNMLVPGQKLLQEELASLLGVSRTPLLSALSKLEREMLISAVPRRGYFVRQIDTKELLDIYDIRLKLEPLGASEAAARIAHHTDRIATLIQLTDTLEREAGDELDTDFKLYDFQFHSCIMEMSDNEYLAKMVSSFSLITLGNLTGMFRRPQDSIKEHRRIIDALASGDADRAEEAMYNHIHVARSRIADKLDEPSAI